jgi:hypothetical protein
MCASAPYTERELSIISAIYSIDRYARFKIKGRLETRQDFLYGGIEWLTDPLKWETVLEKINEKLEADKNAD